MGLMMTLSNYGLSLIGAGRATFLTFTTSIWIIPLAIWIYRKTSYLEVLSFCIGIGGVVLLIEPWKISVAAEWMGNISLIFAAISWSIGILCARHMKWHRSAIQLLPWQLFVATLVPILFVLIVRIPLELNHPSLLLMSAFLYTGSLSIGIGYWIMILISKQLPPSVTSLGLIFVPVVSLVISSLYLKEVVTSDLIFSIILIIGGILIHIYSERKNKKQKYTEII